MGIGILIGLIAAVILLLGGAAIGGYVQRRFGWPWK